MFRNVIFILFYFFSVKPDVMFKRVEPVVLLRNVEPGAMLSLKV